MHIFAQQTNEIGKNPSRNVFFKKQWNCEKSYATHLYSYGEHYLLAEFIDDNTIVINDSGYSVTTSKHISQVTSATRQYKQFFKTQTDLDMVHSHIVNYLKPKLAKAKKPELYIQPILSLFETLNEYLVYTKAKKYKSNAKYKEIKRIVVALNDDAGNYQEKLNILAKKQAKAEALKEKRELKTNLEKFNNYEKDWFRSKEDYLRLSKDGERVESSQQVSVKRENAKALYELIVRGVDIKGKHIENYTVTSINGTLKIGCHSINIESMHAIGKQL